MKKNAIPGIGGETYIPYEARSGEESVVYFTRDLSAEGLRQLSYMKELGMGCDKYKLIDIDNGDTVITAQDAVADVTPFEI